MSKQKLMTPEVVREAARRVGLTVKGNEETFVVWGPKGTLASYNGNQKKLDLRNCLYEEHLPYLVAFVTTLLYTMNDMRHLCPIVPTHISCPRCDGEGTIPV